jgi:hypothetical protein
MVPVVVEGGGEQVVAHVGPHALGAFADRLGVGDSLSVRVSITGERLPLHAGRREDLEGKPRLEM